MGKRLIRYASRKWTLPLALVLLVSGLFLAAFMAFAADGEQQTSWTVYWVDNNNEAESRPSISGGEPAYGTPTLTVEIDGTTYTEEDTNSDPNLLDRLGLSAWPTPRDHGDRHGRLDGGLWGGRTPQPRLPSG